MPILNSDFVLFSVKNSNGDSNETHVEWNLRRRWEWFLVYAVPKLSGLKPWCARLAESVRSFYSAFICATRLKPCSSLRKSVLCMRYIFFVGVMMNYFLSSFPSWQSFSTLYSTLKSLVRFRDCLPVQNKQILDGNDEDRQWKFRNIYCF